MAFYNEFRPRQFGDLVGNTRLVRSLISQVQSDTVHHSYLFCGRSGVGKTTTARILAASILCQNSRNGAGCCGDCQSCRSILEGTHWDVVELDGAHFRGIDDVDDLVRKARLFPFSGHKVYIIDECHRLTAASWDVLLKLLEEPPQFLTMILCTTDPHKVPETVRSRCSVCAFEPPTDKEVREKLERICQRLEFPIEQSRLLYCVSEARGNFRMAENLLEQAYAEYLAEQLEALKNG